MENEKKCKSCGAVFKSDEEARTHKCKNIISLDKPGVWNQRE
jgi:predicted nucleic acid-binding Zn ribbon protein